jgi:hypothetical protein
MEKLKSTKQLHINNKLIYLNELICFLNIIIHKDKTDFYSYFLEKFNFFLRQEFDISNIKYLFEITI